MVSQLRKVEIDEKQLLLLSPNFLLLFCYFFCKRPFLKEKYFCCFIGNHLVDGLFRQIIFKKGDHVNKKVKNSLKNEIYECYVVRISQQHALIFLFLLKYRR